jgi:hypothetical protein
MAAGIDMRPLRNDIGQAGYGQDPSGTPYLRSSLEWRRARQAGERLADS